MHRRRRKSIRFDTMKILVVGFLGVIFLGGFLLWLPICNQQPIAFLDALFTSVTAVCVTGLITITPATQFTLLGKIILLLLIQIGGLGADRLRPRLSFCCCAKRSQSRSGWCSRRPTMQTGWAAW